MAILPPSEFVVFVDKPPEIFVDGGLVHIKDRSGNLVFHKVMSVANFRATIKQAHRIADELAENRPIPLDRARRRKEA